MDGCGINSQEHFQKMLSELALGNKRQSYDTVSLTDDQDREETDLAETMLVIKPKIK